MECLIKFASQTSSTRPGSPMMTHTAKNWRSARSRCAWMQALPLATASVPGSIFEVMRGIERGAVSLVRSVGVDLQRSGVFNSCARRCVSGRSLAADEVMRFRWFSGDGVMGFSRG